ncbi:hypothetical protein HC752_21335 [Vibrio sp. S9_S30]|uniref:DUF7940 domain-containing protein n=1 Tax=Vibrio sp. S9_S30 TaxID=2720226 RepID=UPI001681C08C|nr:hypothetical protein [Vibrio sp. S9_S30]MBD1559489.1 hypothetical protein [Vibrio sp. S9_S30]
MKLIDNWKQSGQWWTIKWSLALIVMNTIISLLPLLEVHVSVTVYAVLNALAAAVTMVLRVLSQAPDPT